MDFGARSSRPFGFHLGLVDFLVLRAGFKLNYTTSFLGSPAYRWPLYFHNHVNPIPAQVNLSIKMK